MSDSAASSRNSTSLPTSKNASFTYHYQPKKTNNKHFNQPILHRCRFTDFTPATITAIACSPTTWDPIPPNPHSLPAHSHRGLLAVGRGNGDIELWLWLNNHHHHSPSSQKLAHYHRKKIGPSSSSHQAWALYRTLPGHLPSKPTTKHPKQSKVEHLVFTHQFMPSHLDHVQSDPQNYPDIIKSLSRTPPRLLGSNGADQVLEWEWDGPRAGTIKRTLEMPPSVAIWSLSVSPGSTRLAIGCDDGTIRIANIADNQLELIRKFDPCKTRLLSIAWGISNSTEPSSSTTNHYPSEPTDSQLFLVTGCADSSLRKWALSSGRCLNRMTVEKLQGEQTLVWTVAVVNGIIISGDSVGNVHFWDAKSCARLQTIRAHRADVLCIAASPDGRSIFTSGVDQKTCQLTLNIQTQKTGVISQSRWLLSPTRRLHSHDVRALQISPPYNPLFSSGTIHPSLNSATQNIHGMVPVLISGGLDMSLVLCPAAPPPSSMATGKVNLNHLPNPVSDSFSVSFADSMQRKISYATTRDPVVHLSPHANLLVCRNSQRISIWRLRSTCSESELLQSALPRKKSTINQQTEDGEAAWAKVVEMDLKCRTNLITSAISPDGTWLAVSDLYEVKLFYMTQVGEVMQPRRVKGFQAFESLKSAQGQMQGARCIEFSADSTRLILAGSLTSDLVVLGLSYSHATPIIKILRIFLHHAAGPLDQADPLRPVITPSALLENPSPELSPSSSPKHYPDHAEVDLESYIVKMAISPDGQWLATADSRRTLRVFNLDAMKHHCYLPMTGSVVNAMAFPGVLGSVLVVGYASNEMEVIEVESGRVGLWGQEEGIGSIREPMQGMVFTPMEMEQQDSDSDEMLLSSGSGATLVPSNNTVVTGLVWGANWIAKIRLPPSLPSLHPRSLTVALKRGRKKEGSQVLPASVPQLEPDASTVDSSKDPSTTSDVVSALPTRDKSAIAVDISYKYHNLLLLNYLSSNQIVLVQLPLFPQISTLRLPPVWVRNGVYGT